MQKSKIKLVVLGLAAVAAMVGVTTALARPTLAEESGNFPTIIQKLVERFGLDQGEVEEVFERDREERHAQMQARYEERLNQAVEDGQITQEQKEAILAKREQMRSECEVESGLSQEEREQNREEHHEEMEAWAEQNGLEMSQLFGLMGGPGGPKGGHFGGPGFGR